MAAVQVPFDFTFTVSDSLGLKVKGTATIIVYPEIRVVSQLKPAYVGVPYQDQLVVEGGSGPPFSFTDMAGLPPGLTMDADGVITGTPTALPAPV